MTTTADSESARSEGSTEFPCRLFAILARKARVGVLLRRGPSRWVRLIKWRTGDDRFEDGQWFRGRIYERRCDLSPDGKLLIYFAAKFSRAAREDEPSAEDFLRAWAAGKRENREADAPYAWTAISRPPWLTALALWPKGNCWHGGGLFDDKRTVLLNHRPGDDCPHPEHRPEGLKVRPNPEAYGEDWPIYSRRLLHDGWELTQEPYSRPLPGGGGAVDARAIWRRPSRDGKWMLSMTEAVNFTIPGGPYVLEFSLRGPRRIEIGRATWADWDQRGRLVLARAGQLLAWRPDEAAEFSPKRIRDFNDDTPQRIQSPAKARRW